MWPEKANDVKASTWIGLRWQARGKCRENILGPNNQPAPTGGDSGKRWSESSVLYPAAPVSDLTPLAHPLPAQVADTYSIIGTAKRQRIYPAVLAPRDTGLVCIWEHRALVLKHQYETLKHSQCSQLKKQTNVSKTLATGSLLTSLFLIPGFLLSPLTHAQTPTPQSMPRRPARSAHQLADLLTCLQLA